MTERFSFGLCPYIYFQRIFKNQTHTKGPFLGNIQVETCGTKWWQKHLLISPPLLLFSLVSEAHKSNQYALLAALRISRLMFKFMTVKFQVCCNSQTTISDKVKTQLRKWFYNKTLSWFTLVLSNKVEPHQEAQLFSCL